MICFAPPNEGTAGQSASASPSQGSGTSSSASPGSAGSSSQESPAGGGSTPSVAPGRESSDAPAGGTDFDFIKDIFGDSSGDAMASPDVAAPQPGAQPAQAQPAQAQPAQPAQQQQPATPSEAAAAPAQQAAPSVQPVGESPRFDPADPFTLAQGLVEHEAAAIESLANGPFRLTPQETEALEADFVGNVPKLLAKVALFSQHQFLTQLGNIIPLMMSRSREQTAKHEANAAKFYEAWPTIDKQKHGQLVNELGVRYRKMFPEATLETMIQHLGPLVLTAIGNQPPPAAAAQPSKGNGARPPTPKGFVPAAPGTAVQISQVADDPFGYMGQQAE